MKTKHWMKLMFMILLFAMLPMVAAQQLAQPPIEGTLPFDDIMPTTSETGALEEPGAVFEVTPILFVPMDVTPVANGLDYVDRHMSNIQHWYAEILNGRTFTLRPAELVIGEHSRTFYFGNCYPPVNPSTCSWGYAMWNRVFNELDSRGYDLSTSLIQGVFFQGEGLSTALGGGRRFLVGFSPATLFPDCTEPGCAHNVSLGGTAHELGHALGLPHPEGDPLWGTSLMGTGFYGFPQCTFINTSLYPEYDKLSTSPFINLNLPLANPGFEGCLAGWYVYEGSPVCVQDGQHSGLKALQLDSTGPTSLSPQSIPLISTKAYNFSGWIRVDSLPAGGEIAIRWKAVDAWSMLVQSLTLVQIDEPTNGWTRIGSWIDLPVNAHKGTLLIETKGVGIQAMLDDLSLAPFESPPPMPLIASAFDGDAVGTNTPSLRWAPVASAAWFDVEIAADPFFESILVSEKGITGYEYISPMALPYDKYSYWRVRAVNGTGSSEWSPTWSVIPLEPGAFYSDEFEEPKLSEAWSFVREDPSKWQIGGLPTLQWRGNFTIDLQSGDLELANNAHNLLLRAMPEGDFALETLANFYVPLHANFQQGGLLIYRDDDNYIKLGHVYRDGWRIEYEGEVNGITVQRSGAWVVDESRLRIERRGTTYTAAYSPSGVGWTPLGQPISVDWPNAKMGLAAYTGPASTQYPTVAFNWLRLTRTCHTVSVAASPSFGGFGGTVTTEGASCDTGHYRPDSPLRLTAQPAPGYVFDHWSGAASGTDNPLVVIVSGPLDIVANFIPDPSNDPYEPNDTFATATPVELGDRLNAAIDSHDDVHYTIDMDFFRFTAEAGMRIRVEVDAGSNLMPYLCLYDGAETELICQLWNADGTNHIDYSIVQDGDYYIRVNSICLEGGFYRRDRYQIAFLRSDPHEPNDTVETATPIEYGDQIDAEIDAHDGVTNLEDKDFFAFSGEAGDGIQVTLALPAGSDLAPFVCLMNSDEEIVLCNEDGLDEVKVTQTLPKDGTYFIKVEGSCSEGGLGCSGSYILALALENLGPLANDDSYYVNMNGTLVTSASRGVLANDSDPDGDTLTAQLVDPPQHGLLAFNGDGSFTFTPGSEYLGDDNFTYRASDGTTESEFATVTIVVGNGMTYIPVTIR